MAPAKASTTKPKQPEKFKATAGLSDADGKDICAAGDTVAASKIDPKSIPWLVKQGWLVPLEEVDD